MIFLRIVIPLYFRSIQAFSDLPFAAEASSSMLAKAGMDTGFLPARSRGTAGHGFLGRYEKRCTGEGSARCTTMATAFRPARPKVPLRVPISAGGAWGPGGGVPRADARIVPGARGRMKFFAEIFRDIRKMAARQQAGSGSTP
jgi:hypothetical protein